MQLGSYFDQTRCSECYTCAVACKDWHDVPAGPASRMRVTTITCKDKLQPSVLFKPKRVLRDMPAKEYKSCHSE